MKLRQGFGMGKLTAIAASIAMVCPYAGAGVTSMLATGSYKLDGSAVTNLSDTYPLPNGSGFVDVLSFPYSNVNGSSAGLHSYGSTTGNFGSRSSGNGIYDVTGSFRINETITNGSGTSQNAVFNFFITPGQVSLDVGSPLGAGQFLTSGLSFNLLANGNSVFNSSATLLANATGTTASFLGTNLYQGGGNYYGVNGGFYSVNLGVLAAGQSLDLSYSLDTFARGNSAATVDRVVDATSYWVPDQWIEQRCYGYGGDGETFVALVEGCVPGTPVFIPGHTVEVPGYTVFARAGGSTAQSGDPFDVGFFTFVDNQGILRGDTFAFGIGNSAQPELPEPGSLALLLAGLGILGWTARRKGKGQAH